MSDGTEAAARSKAHEVIGAGNVGCGVEHRGEGHDAECGRVTALIVEHERALAVEKERVRLLDLALGNAKLRIASDEEACASIDRNLMRVAAERDALAAQLAEVTGHLADADASLKDVSRVNGRLHVDLAAAREALGEANERTRAIQDAFVAATAQVREARLALENVRRICSVPPVPANTPAHLVPDYRRILAAIERLVVAKSDGHRGPCDEACLASHREAIERLAASTGTATQAGPLVETRKREEYHHERADRLARRLHEAHATIRLLNQDGIANAAREQAIYDFETRDAAIALGAPVAIATQAGEEKP